MSSPSGPAPAPDPWPEPGAFEANAAGYLTPGQCRMLLGDPTPPPYVALAVFTVVAMAGAVLWWRFGYGPGLTVLIVGANIGLIVLGMNLEERRNRRRMWSDVSHPTIGNGIGEVVVAEGNVDIRSGVGRIGLGVAAPAAPPAGWYRLHWLEHPGGQRWNVDRILLSARPMPASPVADDEPARPAHGLDPVAVAEVRARLREVLKRTEWELRFNRMAQLSPPQRDELRRYARGRVRLRLAGTAAGTLVSLLMFLAAILAWKRASDDPGRAVGEILSATLGLLATLFTVRAILRLPDAVATVGYPPPLEHASGPATVTLADSENDTWRVAVDGGPTFPATADVARAFRTPIRYTVYHVRRRGEYVLLAAEPGPGQDNGAGDAPGWPRSDRVTANAAGWLTPAQRSEIVGERIRWRSTYLLLTPVLIVAAGVTVPYVVHHYRPRQIAVGDGTDLVVTLSIAAAIVAAWAGLMLRHITARRQRGASLMAPVITSSVGEIVWSGGRYHIRGTPVRLPLPSGDHVLPEPGPYRFYWLLAPAPTLLSAEPLRNDA